jgi:cation diffusion facilitator CzcD-associated flavoprotein CzcO
MEHFDVIVVGAGLSGIGAAYHLQTEAPQKSYVLLEGREASGGTWDLFRYPGIRSDSDMHTLGYNFKPWREAKAIADGPSILKYVRTTASENGIDRNIRYRHMVKLASWDSGTSRWTVEAEMGEAKQIVRFTCSFLFMCSGYYAYSGGYDPEFAGRDTFKGPIVHPQKWPSDLDYKNKKVVVIGSGATAVTVVPAMANDAAHVTMLQRSPTYMVSRPAEDKAANWLRDHLPAMLAYQLIRWRNVLFGMYFFNLSRKKPAQVKKYLIDMLKNELPEDYDLKTHFTPSYNPWDQRLCLVPDSDFFQGIKNDKVSIVTDRIDTFTPTGIKLKSGKELDADIVVTATGLKLEMLGGMQVVVDGVPQNMAQTMSYKGMMYSDVPNLASCFGYTNASWTLKCDLTCEYVTRLLNYMDRKGYAEVRPRKDASVEEAPWLDFSSGYVQRAKDVLPRQGNKKPWKLYQNYALDLVALRYGKVNDGTLRFSKPKLAALSTPESMKIAAE